MRAGLGRHRHRRHAGQRGEPVRQLVDQRQRALHGRDRLQRMEVGEARQPRHLLVQPRIVLHGAGAERIERRCRWRNSSATGAHNGARSRGSREPGQADRALRAQAAEARSSTSAARADRRRSAAVASSSKISGSSMVQPAVAGEGRRLGAGLRVAGSGAPLTARSLMPAPPAARAVEAVEIFVGVGFGGRHDQQVVAGRPCGIKPRAGTPARTPLRRQRIDHRAARLGQAQGEFVEEAARHQLHARQPPSRVGQAHAPWHG